MAKGFNSRGMGGMGGGNMNNMIRQAQKMQQDMLSRPDITRPMAELCQKLTGTARQVDVQVGQAPPEDAFPAPSAPAAGVDALDAFLAQGGSNIIVE